MPRALRIFISHSAHAVDEPATQDFLDALIVSLQAEAGAFEPLADRKDLQEGDEWFQRLYAWMGLCDAAVILLSPRAIRRTSSTWVPRETNLLLWRQSLDPRFVVIPVFIGGLEPEDLAANPFIAESRLAALQFARGLSDGDKIARVTQVLKDKLGAAAARVAFDPLRVHVEDCIERYAPHESVQAVLVSHFGEDAWQPAVPETQKLSLKLVQRAAEPTVDAAISAVTLGSQGDARLGARLFETLYPLRLPADSACRLLKLCREQEGRGAVLVNARDTWIVRMLLRAATGLPKDDLPRVWQIVELPDGWGDRDLEEVTRYLAEELAGAVLGTNGWDELSDRADPAARFEEQMQALAFQLAEYRAETGAPIVVGAAYSARWAEMAATLAATFRTAVFLFWTGDAAAQVGMPAGACTLLEPSWTPGRDQAWRLEYRRKLKQFGGAIA